MPTLSLLEAVNSALKKSLSDNEDVILLGEDIGINGGVFRATNHLQAMFGEERVRDTPLAESMIIGVSVGLAASGFRPIAEIQFMGFVYPGFDQIINHVSRLRNRTRGRLTCPLVIRMPYGGGIHAPEHHSESSEALFAHIPGLKVLIPSSPQQAYGLLLAAVKANDPIMFLEPKRIYHQFKQEVDLEAPPLPLDQSFVIKEGHDVTLISWGAMLYNTMKVAKQLERDNISAEIIDVASIKPLDHDTILTSLKKTGRAVIVHEAPKTCGVGAEIAAFIAEEGLNDLYAPIQRVAGYDTIMPYPKLEHYYMPSDQRILNAVQAVMRY